MKLIPLWRRGENSARRWRTWPCSLRCPCLVTLMWLVSTWDGENKKRIDALQASLSKSRYSTNKATYFSLVKYIDEGEGTNSLYQVDAFLACWISYFVFLSLSEDRLRNFMFLMAVLLAQGKWLVLAPLFLGDFYACLDECSKNVRRWSIG